LSDDFLAWNTGGPGSCCSTATG